MPEELAIDHYDALRDLYDEADDGEAAILDDLRKRAGHTRDCEGTEDDRHCWTVVPGERCAHCGTTFEQLEQLERDELNNDSRE